MKDNKIQQQHQMQSSHKYVPIQHARGRDITLDYTGASQQTIQLIKSQMEAFHKEQSKSPTQGPLKNVFIAASPYSIKQGGQRRTFPQIYNFYLKGRDDEDQNYFEGKKIPGKIYFPNNYPDKSPLIVLDELAKNRPFQFVNCYLTGEVCLSGKAGGIKQTNLIKIMIKLENVIYEGNSKDAANTRIEKTFQDHFQMYQNFLREQGKLLPNLDD